MFPHSLAGGPFSLRAGEACCAVSVSAVVNADGSLGDVAISPSTVTPTYRLTYDDVDEMMYAGTEEDEPELHALLQVSTAPPSPTPHPTHPTLPHPTTTTTRTPPPRMCAAQVAR